MSSTMQTLSQIETGRSPSEHTPEYGQSNGSAAAGQNVGNTERIVSASAGAILVVEGLARRDLIGLTIAGVGAALAYRGATGHCSMYQSLGIDTAHKDGRAGEREKHDVRIAESMLIDKSPEDLYSFWRNFENLPQIMTHLESVRVTDEKRSHWVAKAPSIYGGQVEWDAEIAADEPNSRIAWRALPGSDIEHSGSVQFTPAPGNRGTKVRVILEYQPPAGQVGRWVAKMFGEEPETQIWDDLRNFKRRMEVGEVLTVSGQPRGTCLGRGRWGSEWGT